METNSKSVEANKKIARQSFEAFEKKDPSILDKITDQAKYRLHFPGQPEPLNFEEAKKNQQEYTSAFPDLKVTFDNQVAEGDYVVSRLTFNGTHKGEFQKIAASGKPVKVTGTSIQKIVNGKIVEEWAEFDALGMMTQIGAVPEMTNHNHD